LGIAIKFSLFSGTLNLDKRAAHRLPFLVKKLPGRDELTLSGMGTSFL
jgi:hypothetical protein